MRTLEQVLTEIITLSKEAFNSSIFWRELLKRCERYKALMGVADLNKFKMELNTQLCEIKNKQIDRYIYRFQLLIEELNQYG